MFRQALQQAGVALRLDTGKRVDSSGCSDKDLTFKRGDRTIPARYPCHWCMPISPSAARGTYPQSPGQLAADMAEAVGRYPRSVLDKAGVKSVRLCSQIVAKGAPAGGAVLDVYAGSLWIDIHAGFSGKGILHQLLFRYFDRTLFFEETHFGDEAWAATNDPSFSYGARDAGPLPKGMLNHRATESLRSDRATVFELMMAAPEHVCERLRDDEHLASKVRLLIARLKKVFADDVAFIDPRLSRCSARQ